MDLFNEQYDAYNNIINTFAKYFWNSYENYDCVNLNDNQHNLNLKFFYSLLFN